MTESASKAPASAKIVMAASPDLVARTSYGFAHRVGAGIRWRTTKPSQTNLEFAEHVFQSGDSQIALKSFGKLANKNSLNAEYWLGHMNEIGLGIPRDATKTVELSRRPPSKTSSLKRGSEGECMAAAHHRIALSPAQASTPPERNAVVMEAADAVEMPLPSNPQTFFLGGLFGWASWRRCMSRVRSSFLSYLPPHGELALPRALLAILLVMERLWPSLGCYQYRTRSGLRDCRKVYRAWKPTW